MDLVQDLLRAQKIGSSEGKRVSCLQEQSEQDLTVPIPHCEERSDAAIQPLEGLCTCCTPTPTLPLGLFGVREKRGFPATDGFALLHPTENPPLGEGAKRKSAFTLAEVLITLGIIGVVAAMTLLALIQNYEKKVFVSKIKQTYSIMSNAMLSSVAEHGAPNTWEYSKLNSEDPNYQDKTVQHVNNMVQKYFKPYLSVVEEGEARPFAYYLVLKNGVTLYFYPNGYFDGDNNYINRSLLIVGSLNKNKSDFYDITRNYSRKDFAMTVGIDTPNARIDLYKSGSCNTETPVYKRLKCAYIIQQNGWEIPDDYPW